MSNDITDLIRDTDSDIIDIFRDTDSDDRQ